MSSTIRAVSLFANVGIAETYLKDCGVEVVLANEIDPKRARFYQEMYPESEMVCGDITQPQIKELLLKKAKEKDVRLLMATPPCQGMSVAGKQNPFDERNTLICHAVELIKQLRPEYVFLENVAQLLSTYILVRGNEGLIPDYLEEELDEDYFFDIKVVDAADYGVPQTRKRSIILLTRKDVKEMWHIPEGQKEKKKTLRETIGDLPSVDPLIHDVDPGTLYRIFPDFETKKETAAQVSPYHRPPKHPLRQVVCMMHTPEGKTAFDNPDEYKPKRPDGKPVKGFRTTYKRQSWDKPGATVTMCNGGISSQNNVHPGRCLGKDENGDVLYSEPRVLTLYELFLVSSLPVDWAPPSWASDNLIRKTIGEGVPPLLVKEIFQALPER